MANDGRGKILVQGTTVSAPCLEPLVGTERVELVKIGETSSKVRYKTGEEISQLNDQIFNLK